MDIFCFCSTKHNYIPGHVPVCLSNLLTVPFVLQLCIEASGSIPPGPFLFMPTRDGRARMLTFARGVDGLVLLWWSAFTLLINTQRHHAPHQQCLPGKVPVAGCTQLPLRPRSSWDLLECEMYPQICLGWLPFRAMCNGAFHEIGVWEM